MSTIEAAFHHTMLDGYQQLAKLGYRPTYFLQMVQERGGVETARFLLNKEEPSTGFNRLWEMGRLDLAVEAFVLKPNYRALFSDEERQRARQRLALMQYRAPWDTES